MFNNIDVKTKLQTYIYDIQRNSKNVNITVIEKKFLDLVVSKITCYTKNR